MKKNIKLVVSMLLFLQIVCVFPAEKVAAAPLTKTMTHTIIQSYWSSSKNQGPEFYDYDDGLWYGTLTRVSSTWQERRDITSWYSGILSNDESHLESKVPDYRVSWITEDGYENVKILEQYWTSAMREGKFLGSNGLYYKYGRDCYVKFEYDSFRYTSTYSGTVIARTIPPVLKLSNKDILENSRYHNQDKIIVEGFVKDEDINDKNTIHYSVTGTNNVVRNINLVEPTQITANGNDIYFKGYIQLDQTIVPGNYVLKIWARDDKGADSNIVEVPIIIYNLLEDILSSLKSYTLKQDELQFITVNSNVPVLKSSINDNLINKIKKELLEKNILIYFIGNEESRSYINSSLLGN